jgi:hypothetical protein
MLISYFLALLVIWNISNVQMVKLKSEKNQSDEIKKQIDCKICQEMFQYEFNYEKLLKDGSKISLIKSFFEEIKETEFNLKEYLSKDNLDFVSKEISMQYFFKGEDSLFSSEEQMEKFKSCKTIKTAEAIENGSLKLSSQCEIMKLKICENVLSIEADFCVNFHKKIPLFKSTNKNKFSQNKDNSAFSDDNSNDLIKIQKSNENEIINKNEKQKLNDADNSKAKMVIEKNAKDNHNEIQSTILNEYNLNSSFIANNNIDDFERLKNSLNGKIDNNKNQDKNGIQETLKKLMELKGKTEPVEIAIYASKGKNLRSKQINKFISLDFNGLKQDAITQEEDALLDKYLNKFLHQENSIKSKLPYLI